MKYQQVMMTPQRAKAILEKLSPNQRKIRWKFITNTLVRAIKSGQWKLTHQPIAIDTEGFLIDGQHRLLAIAQCDVAVPIVLCTGAPSNSFDCIDIGIKRTVTDILKMTTNEAACYATIHRIRMGAWNASVTPQDTAAVQEIASPFYEKLMEASAGKRKIVSSGPVAAAAVIRMLDGERQGYVLKVWADMIKFNARELPPIAVTFLKQADRMTAGGAAGQAETFARAWSVFDETKSDNSKIQIKDPTATAAEALKVVERVFRRRSKQESEAA